MISLLQRVYTRQIQQHRGSSMTPGRFATRPVPTMSDGSQNEVEDLSVVAKNDFDGIDVNVSLQSDTSGANCIRENIDDGNGVSKSGNGNIGGLDLFRDATSQLAASEFNSKLTSKPKLRLLTQTTQNEKLKQVQVESSFSSITTIHCDKRLHIGPLTPATLLATLFLLPSPFPPSYAAATSSQLTTTALPSLTSDTSIIHSNIAVPTLPTSKVSPAEAASKLVSSPMYTSFDMTSDSEDLLLLASQPLIRGAECIPYLGPTGNVNLVLAARRLIREALRAVGRLELFSNASKTTPGLQERSEKSKARSSFEDGDAHREDERVLDEAQQAMRDAEDFLKVSECVLSVIGGWKERMKEDEGVLPPSVKVDDGIVIEEGLINVDEFLGGAGKSNYVVVEEKEKGGGDGDVEMDDETVYEREVEEFRSLGSGKKRKRSDATLIGGLRKKGKGKEKREEQDIALEDMLGVDWACPSCGNLL